MKYKIGDKIKILFIDDPFVNYYGRTGTIEQIDDIGQLHGTWGGCAIVPGVDVFEVLNDEEVLYEELCSNCERAKACHESCEYCDEFYERLEDE